PLNRGSKHAENGTSPLKRAYFLLSVSDFNEIFFGGELKHWTPPSKQNFKEKTIIKFSKNIHNSQLTWYSPGYHQYSSRKLFSASNSFPVEAKHTIRCIASQLLHLLVVDVE